MATWTTKNRNGANCSGLYLNNGESVTRVVSVLRQWTKIRIAIRFSIAGAPAAALGPTFPVVDPTIFFFGLCANGRDIKSGDSHCLGFRFDTGWTYNVAGYWTAGGWPTQYVNGIQSNAGTGFNSYYQRQENWSHDGAIALEITKGNPNWTMEVTHIQDPTAWGSPIPIALWKGLLETRTLNLSVTLMNVPTGVANYIVQPPGASFAAPNEAVEGYLDTFQLYWATASAAKACVTDAQISRIA